MKRLLLSAWLLLVLALALVACGDAYTPSSDLGGPIASPTTQNQVNTPVQLMKGTFQEFSLPQGRSGLMRPAIDKNGYIWFGEMSRNYLGAFDPQSQQFWQQTPPGGKSGIMGIVVTPDDTIWFAEQYADYIGSFSPKTSKYHVYQLPAISVPDPGHPGQTQSLPSAPNDLVLDQHGTLWFTELNASAIGSLNTATGALRQYSLGREKNGGSFNPYGIAVDPQGVVWFSEASTNRLGRLDPASGQVRYFTSSSLNSPLMELASDARGHIWATVFARGLLFQFDPAASTFTAYSSPGVTSDGGSLYGLWVASNGDIWVAATAQNLVARLAVKQQRFYAYTIPTANSLPMGLVEDAHHAIWFTEAGSDKIGVLQP